MKECPNCKKIFPEDLFYCLDDGTRLADGAATHAGLSARTEILPNMGESVSTVVLPGVSPPTTAEPPSYNRELPTGSPSKFLYFAVGALTLACITLAAAMVVINRDRIFSGTKNQPANLTNSAPTPTPIASATPQIANTAKQTNQTATLPGANISPDGKWKGEWSTDSGTLLDFELTLNETGTNGVEGQIRWTMRRTARPDKVDKVGMSATEYVRGAFDPATRTLNMSGTSKDDPNNVLVMVDVYKLNISPDGHTLSGVARNGGKWNGHIKLTR